eukprot:COSAG04_NODE_56_length_30604_cov_692.571119_12_plen_122_part_00
MAQEHTRHYLISKGLEKLRPALEPIVTEPPFELAWDDLCQFVMSIDKQDIASILEHPKQFLLDHRSDIVWLRLKPYAEAEEVSWSAVKPQVDLRIQEDTFKDHGRAEGRCAPAGNVLRRAS